MLFGCAFTALQPMLLYLASMSANANHCVQAVVVVWQIGDSQKDIETHAGSHSFWDIFKVIIDGALVPLIVRPYTLTATDHCCISVSPQAIYPTVIIVLVALNRSHVENGMASTGQTSSSGTASIRLTTVRVDTATASHYDHQPPRRSEVLIIGERGFGLGSLAASEGASTHAINDDERKLELDGRVI